MPQLQEELSATEFVRARLYCQQEDRRKAEAEWKDLHREDYYLAVVAHQVYQLKMVVAGLFSKSRVNADLTVNDFLLHRPLKDKKPKKLTAEQKQAKLDAVKAGWLAFAGVSPKAP